MVELIVMVVLVVLVGLVEVGQIVSVVVVGVQCLMMMFVEVVRNHTCGWSHISYRDQGDILHRYHRLVQIHTTHKRMSELQERERERERERETRMKRTGEDSQGW
jgi:hypothetical protein